MSEYVDDLVADVYPPQSASSLAQAAQILAAAGVNHGTSIQGHSMIIQLGRRLVDRSQFVPVPIITYWTSALIGHLSVIVLTGIILKDCPSLFVSTYRSLLGLLCSHDFIGRHGR